MARHYLDHASTTPLRPEARAAMAAWADEGVTADPGRVHTEGRMVRAALEEAREQVAGLFGVRPRQVVFTSGGTESINAAVWGALRSRPGPVACAAVEHSAVRDASARDRPGRDGRRGPVRPHQVGGGGGGARPLPSPCTGRRPPWSTASGPTTRWARCSRWPRWSSSAAGRGVLIHVDAVAAAGHLPCDLGELGADLVSVSAHKLGGPTGIGALIVRRGLRIEPLSSAASRSGPGGPAWRTWPGPSASARPRPALAAPGALAPRRPTARRRTDRLAEAATVGGRASSGSATRIDRLPHIVCLGRRRGRGRAGPPRPRPGRRGRPLGVVVLVGGPRALARCSRPWGWTPSAPCGSRSAGRRPTPTSMPSAPPSPGW